MSDIITLGTILEYFDFISFSLIYPHICFVKSSRQSLNFIVQFILGYGGRFIGSLLVLIFRKHFDEQKILIISVWVMTISTLSIALLPNYYFSFYILLILRLLQGIAFAVEFPVGALVNSRSAISGTTQGYILALTCYNLIFTYIPYEFIKTIAWKVPFLLGGLSGIFLLRQRMKFGVVTIQFNIIYNNLFIIVRILQIIFIGKLGYDVIHNRVPSLSGFEMPIVNIYFTIIPILYFGAKFIVKDRLFKQITSMMLYIFLLQSSIRCSSGQAYLISHYPHITSVHIIALIASILILRYADYKIIGYKVEDIILFVYITDIISAGLFNNSILYLIHNKAIYFGSAATVVLLCIGQLIITICINKSLYIIKNLLKHHKYLMPITYNLVASTAFLGFDMTKLKFMCFNEAHYYLITRIAAGLIGFICRC